MKYVEKDTIGGRIRDARQTQCLRLKDLAAKIGVTANYVSMIERGVKTPSDELLHKIANTLCVSMNWLKDSTGTRNSVPGPDNLPELSAAVVKQATRLSLAACRFAAKGVSKSAFHKELIRTISVCAAVLDNLEEDATEPDPR